MKAPAHGQGFTSVLFALLGNFAITIMKFAGFLMSGSSSLFSESIHSFADTMNQSLLMVGIKRSAKVADEKFAYGYGQERFFWALVSAVGIFFLGAGVTFVYGITSLKHPEIIKVSPIIFYILLASFVIEVFTFCAAVRELRKNNKHMGFRRLLKEGDPTTIAVIYEDGVALIGVVIASVSILLTEVTGKYYWDAFGSILIGLMLATMAVILVNKNRGFLVKRSIPDEVKRKIIKMLEADPAVEKVIDFKSTIIDMNCYHIKCEIEFNGSVLLNKLGHSHSFKEEFEQVDGDFEEFKKLSFRYVDRVPRLIGKHIDEIEKRIQAEFPNVMHIDIEIN